MKKKRVTLADVARLAGLSRTSASMILTGRPDTRLSQEAHMRVYEAAKKLGYRPNIAARSLRTNKTQTIGFISDFVATTRFANGLIRGALEAAEGAGHILLVLETGGEPSRQGQAIEAVIDRQVDGIIFASMRSREVFVPDMPVSTKVVMLNATNERFPTSVLADEFEGGRSAVRLLAEAGVKKGVALVGQSDRAEKHLFRSETIARRLAGIRREMKRHRMKFAAEESCWSWEPEYGFEITQDLLRRGDDLRALLCLNDRLAFGAYQAVVDAGLKVGRDISVVSFDNDELANYLRPGLTTIALPHEQMGKLAVELLLSEKEDGGPHLVEMPVVERGSISKMKAKA